MKKQDRNSLCKGRTKAGKPCRAAATAGGLCFFHANPDKAAELGRIGGERGRRVTFPILDPLPKLDSAIAVGKTAARLIADGYCGRLSSKVADSLARLFDLYVRSTQTATLAARVAELKKSKVGQPTTETVSAKG